MGTREAMDGLIQADPSDWESWLVYADYLTDRGDLRGELIVLEHRLETAALSDKEREALTARLRSLVETHQEEWLQGWTIPEWTHLQWRRGFVAGLSVHWSRDSLAAIEALAAHPAGRFLKRLDLSGNNLRDEDLPALCRGQALRSIVSLDLSRTRTTARGAQALAASESVRALQTLHLDENHLGDHGALALAGSGALRSLRVLSLSFNGIADEGAAALAGSEALRSLQVLNLSFNNIGEQGKATLAQAEALRACQVIL